MLGRRSLCLDLEPFNPEIERSLREIRAKKKKSKNKMTEEQPTPPPKQLKEYFTPATYDSPTRTRMPTVTVPFEIKHSLIQMLPSFYGLESENPFKHVDAFLEICSTVFLNNISDDALRLRLFPFSLKDKAKAWLDTKTNITTWDQLQKEFLKKFFSIGKLTALRRAITTFSQNKNEQLHESWERFKELLRCCPHHEIPMWQLVQSFYSSLDEHNRQMVDASCGGSFLYKTPEEAWELFEHLSENSHLHATSSHSDLPRQLGSKGGIYEVSHSIDLSSKVDALAKKFDQLLCMNKVSNAPNMQDVCSICASPMHASAECPCIGKSDCMTEQVNAAQGFPSSSNPYSNSYNHGWRNHPNFSWRSQNVENPQAQSYRPIPPGFQNQRIASPSSHQTPQAPSGSSEIDKIISALGTLTSVVQNVDSKVQGIESKLHIVDSHSQSIAKLETQLGQLAIAVSKREGKFPSCTTKNPKSQQFEQFKVVMVLREVRK